MRGAARGTFIRWWEVRGRPRPELPLRPIAARLLLLAPTSLPLLLLAMGAAGAPAPLPTALLLLLLLRSLSLSLLLQAPVVSSV